MVTTLGKFLDPLADKLLIVAALIGLIPTRDVPAWMVIVIVGREIAVTGLRGMAVSQGLVISSSISGKYKTFFEVAAIFSLILDGKYFTVDLREVGLVLLGISIVFAVYSGVAYFKKFLKELIA